MKAIDKAIRLCYVTDANGNKIKNASGTILGELVKKDGDNFVVRDPYGGVYLIGKNDFNWLISRRNTVPIDIRSLAMMKLN